MGNRTLLCSSRSPGASALLPEERKKKVLVLIPLDLDGYLFNGWNSGKASQVRERVAAAFFFTGTTLRGSESSVSMWSAALA